MPTLILLSGPPGAGKTTFANALSALLPFKHVESDAIRASLFPSPTHSRKESARVFMVAEKMATRALEKAEHVVVDATNLREEFRIRFFELAARMDAPSFAVRLTAPEATIRERVQKPREGFSTAGEEVFENLRGTEEPLGVSHLVVDTRFALDAALALVLSLVRDE